MKVASAKLEIYGLSVELSGKKILRDVSAIFPAGMISAVIGPNGSGKSTLARAVCGLYAASGVCGDILIDGKNIPKMEGRERARNIAFFPQARPVPDLTVMEMIRHGRYPYRNPGGGLSGIDKAAINAATQSAGIDALRARKLATLSGGERQRAYLAMMLAQDARLLLLDEPTAHLDISAQIEVLDMLEAQKKASKTIVGILHDIPQAFTVADAVYIMREGNIICAGAPDDSYVISAAESAFGVRIVRNEDGRLYKYDLRK
jgi:iron complex transport system ATP-binding protein